LKNVSCKILSCCKSIGDFTNTAARFLTEAKLTKNASATDNNGCQIYNVTDILSHNKETFNMYAIPGSLQTHSNCF